MVLEAEAIKRGVVLIKWAWLENFCAHDYYNPTILKILDPPLLVHARGVISLSEFVWRGEAMRTENVSVQLTIS